MKIYYKTAKGFTLIELLTVIAIIGILAAIIIPTTGAVRTSAKKAQTKSQFSQWASAFTLFKQEYGYYPKFGSSGSFVLSSNTDAEKFAGTLTGRNLDGVQSTSVPTEANLNGNRKKLSFYSISDNEILGTGGSRLLTDAFGNPEIGIIVDSNGDGRITSADGAPGSVRSADSGSFTPTTSGTNADIPAAGVRAGVIIYSAGKGSSGPSRPVSSGEAVMSWK
jgi:prepilin-type N-terminal cleavage/methylation domain-containing protein